MVLINIAALIVAVAAVVLVIALVPLLRELRATAAAVKEVTLKFDREMEPTIRELQKSLADINVITGGAAERVEELQCFMSAVGETGRGLRTIGSVVGGAADALAKSSLWITGAKVAASFMMDRMTKKRG
jgi:uncharacterized protein YoxC